MIVGSKVMTYRLNITDKTTDSGKLKTLSHNFWSNRQFLVYAISNRKYRRDSRFDKLLAEN